MAESENSSRLTSSPLFEKMDAFLARHRGLSAVKADIPVLTDEASIEEPPPIPVLTDVVFEPEPTFDSHDFFTDTSRGPKASAPTETIFFDLPLLNLEGLADNPAGLPDAVNQEVVASPDILADEESALPQAIPDSAPDEFEIEELLGVDVQEPELSLTEQALSHDESFVADTDAPLPAPKLTQAAIAEITASVAAQIAVDMSSEVAQLTRQHFASMMNTFYSVSLHQLTEEISRDMEMCLAPRITELVQEELRRQGLLE